MNKLAKVYNLESSKTFLALYLLMESKKIKYDKIVYSKIRKHMDEIDGIRNFNRLFRAFGSFISIKEEFKWENCKEKYNLYLTNLPSFAQSILNGVDCEYVATYYFECDGIKYTLDIELVPPGREEFQIINEKIFYCNVVEFGDTYSYLDKKVQIIFLYDRENRKLIDILSITENELSEDNIAVLKILTNRTIERLRRKISVQ